MLNRNRTMDRLDIPVGYIFMSHLTAAIMLKKQSFIYNTHIIL